MTVDSLNSNVPPFAGPNYTHGTVTSALTDFSISSLTGSSQTLVNQNPNRHYLLIENVGNANIGINLTGGTAAISSAGTFTIVANGSIVYETKFIPSNTITVIGTAGQPISCVEG